MYKTLRGCMSAEVKVKLATTLLVFIVFRVFQAKVHRPIREFCAHLVKKMPVALCVPVFSAKTFLCCIHRPEQINHRLRLLGQA